MLAILVLIRDALLALALGWVGVTIEQRDAPQHEPAQEQRQ
jgi:hypothetical protein